MSTFSYSRGKRIAKIIGGSQDGQNVYLYDPGFKCCPKCSDICIRKQCCKHCSRVDYHTDYTPDKIKAIVDKIKNGQIDELELDEIDEASATGAPVKAIELRGGKFQIMPSNQPFNSPDCMYISGRRGSGKSFFISEYLEQFKKCYPHYRVYLFSQKKEDALLDQYIHKRIDVTQVKEAMFEAADFKASLVIFDDVDSLPDEGKNSIKDAVYAVMTDVIEVGRSLGVFCIVTSHLAANNNESKRILNGCTSFTFSLNSSSHATEYALKNYFGFGTKQIQKILQQEDSRAVTIFRDCPQVVMTNSKMVFQSEIMQNL